MSYILFINPPISMKECYGTLAPAGGNEPPFGLCYLASVMRESGHKAKIIDAKVLNLSLDDVIDAIIKDKPDYIGISSTTITVENAAKISAKIKTRFGDIPVIIGGCHITALPEETLKMYPCFDIAVVGEGEETLLELLEVLNSKNDLSKVQGIVFRRNGKFVKTTPRKRIKNLDRLPLPAFDLLPELSRYRISTQSVDRLPAVSLITSRGCSGSCTFCDRSVFGNLCRAHSAEYIIDMVKLLVKRYGIRSILFEDDNFLLFRKRVYEFVELLKREQLDLTWSALGRVDMVTKDLLKKMKEGGCWQILYGIESASQKILDIYKKNLTPQQAEEALKMTKEAGIMTKGFFMIGNPLEDESTLEETLGFIKRAPLDDISLAFFTPFPGSEIYETIDNYGSLDSRWNHMSGFRVVFVPKGLTKESLEHWTRMIYRTFYFRTKTILTYLSRLREGDLFKELITSALSLTRYILKK